jgi:hypothetical protein
MKVLYCKSVLGMPMGQQMSLCRKRTKREKSTRRKDRSSSRWSKHVRPLKVKQELREINY